jgi:hypothetical protein
MGGEDLPVHEQRAVEVEDRAVLGALPPAGGLAGALVVLGDDLVVHGVEITVVHAHALVGVGYLELPDLLQPRRGMGMARDGSQQQHCQQDSQCAFHFVVLPLDNPDRSAMIERLYYKPWTPGECPRPPQDFSTCRAWLHTARTRSAARKPGSPHLDQLKERGDIVRRTIRNAFLGLILAAAALPAYAQRTTGARAPAFVFATPAQGSAVLGTRDDFVRATGPLERSARLRTAEPVDEERFLKHMRGTTREWTDEQRAGLERLTEPLATFLWRVKWRMPGRVLLVQATPALEDDTPHTRANAIIIPSSLPGQGPGMMGFVLSHEVFHVITRHNPELKERLYEAIGFKRCETVSIPPSLARLRITNPDTVENRHTIAVRYRGQPVEALPYTRFASDDIDPRQGIIKQLQVAWVLVDRKGTDCSAREDPQAGVDPNDLEGLFEQIGRNTQHLLHPDEVLADNFVELFFAAVSGKPRQIASPEVLEKIRRIIFD